MKKKKSAAKNSRLGLAARIEVAQSLLKSKDQLIEEYKETNEHLKHKIKGEQMMVKHLEKDALTKKNMLEVIRSMLHLSVDRNIYLETELINEKNKKIMGECDEKR